MAMEAGATLGTVTSIRSTHPSARPIPAAIFLPMGVGAPPSPTHPSARPIPAVIFLPMEAGAPGTALPSPTHPSAGPIRSSSPPASIPPLEQPVSGENSEEKGGNDVQQKKSREKESDKTCGEPQPSGRVEQRDGSRVPKSLPSSKKIGSSSASKKVVESASRKNLKFPDLLYFNPLAGGLRGHQKIAKSANLVHSIPSSRGFQKLQLMGRADTTDVADTADLLVSCSGAAPDPMAASTACIKRGAKKDPTSPAEGVSLNSIGLVLMVVVAVAIPILLLVRFDGHPMSQVWILSLSICSYVFFFLLFIWRSWWFCTNFFRLSYGPLLAILSAIAIGPATATFVLIFSMVWAAGNLGYSLAVHRLRMGTESAIHVAPKNFCPTRDSVKSFTFWLYRGAPFVVLLCTLFIGLFLNVATVTDELDILLLFSYFSWVHVAAWLIIVHLGPMHGFPLKKQMEWLVPALPAGLLLSPVITIVSQILSVLCNLLLMLALVAFLWYSLAIYMHFLATATPRTTTRGNEDTLRTKILEDNIEQVKSDSRLGETPSEAAVTVGIEDTLQCEILEDKIRQTTFNHILGTTSSEAAATLGNEDSPHRVILYNSNCTSSKPLPSSTKIGSSSASEKIVETFSRKKMEVADLLYLVRLLMVFKRHLKIEKSANLIHSIPLPETPAHGKG